MIPAHEHDRPPPTEKDPLAGPAPAPGPRPKGRGAQIALAAVATFFVLLAAGGAAFYFFVWKYEATARRHLPDNAVLAVRVEMADVLLFKPVREHIWPILEQKRKGKKDSRLEFIRQETGVDLQKDVREIVVSSVDATGWVVAFGGTIERGRAVEGLKKVLEKEGAGEWKVKSGLLRGPGGLTIGQADDGTILVGTNEDVVRSALPESDTADKLGLPPDGALAFTISEEAVKQARKAAGPLASGGALKKMNDLHGKMTLGDAPKLSVDIRPDKGVEPDDLASDVEELIQDVRLLLFLAPDVAGEKKALRDAEVKAEKNNVHVDAPWPYDSLDDAAQHVAESLAEILPRE